jgi:hypothetical protein
MPRPLLCARRGVSRARRGALLFLAFVTFGSFTLGVGCSAKKGGGSKWSSVEGFCDDWATRACSDSVVTACASTNADSCRDSQRAFCEKLVPDAEYSDKNAEACLDAVGDAYKDAVLTSDERKVVLELGGVCSKILSGSVGAGGSCRVDKDCNRDDDLECVKKSTKNACAIPVLVAAGHSCSAAGAVCEEGFYCRDGEFCVTLDVDDTCSDVKPCGVEARCVFGNASTSVDGGDGGDGVADTGEPADDTTGKCVAREANGADCTSDDECIGGICLDRANGKKACTDKIPLSRAEPTCADLQ